MRLNQSLTRVKFKTKNLASFNYRDLHNAFSSFVGGIASILLPAGLYWLWNTFWNEYDIACLRVKDLFTTSNNIFLQGLICFRNTIPLLFHAHASSFSLGFITLS